MATLRAGFLLALAFAAGCGRPDTNGPHDAGPTAPVVCRQPQAVPWFADGGYKSCERDDDCGGVALDSVCEQCEPGCGGPCRHYACANHQCGIGICDIPRVQP